MSVPESDQMYRPIDSPDPLYDNLGQRCSAIIDHDEEVIWIDPDVTREGRQSVIERAQATLRISQLS